MFLKDHNKTAIIWGDEKISYNTLLNGVNHYAGLFGNNSTGKTAIETVAIYSENRPEWAYAFYSSWKNKCVAVPIDFMSTPDEVAYILNDCRPGVVFCSNETKKNFEAINDHLEYQPRVLLLDDIHLPEQETNAAPLPDPDINQTAVIIYTSGTTGSPKGVMLSYDNLLANIESVVDYVHIYTPQRNVMVMLPLHHIFPLLGSLVAPFFVGATTAFCPSLSTADIMSTLQNNQIAIIIGVPRFYDLIRKGIMEKINSKGITRLIFKTARAFKSRGFSRFIFKSLHRKFGGHVTFMVCGGAKLDETVASDMRILGFEMLEGFGMTEAAPMITFTRPGRVKIGSAGERMPTLEVKAKDGEIVAKGRNIMQGYYNREEETAEVLKDGWLHTGDLGYIDDNGFIHITGRRKEIIVLSNGKNINPEEIENKIQAMSNLLLEVGVYQKDDNLQAAIFPDFKKVKEKKVLNLAETIRWDVIDAFNQKVSPYKRINKFIILKEELPKTRLGKIQRFKLPEFAVTSTEKRKNIVEPKYEEYHVIKEYLQKQTDGEIYPDAHFEIDLGLDSLDKVSFMAFLQNTFGIKTKDDLFVRYPTLEKLSNYIKEKKVKIQVEAVKWAEILKEKIDLKLPKRWITQTWFKYLFKGFSKLYFRYKGEGLENLPKGPFILAPNHQSSMDPLLVAAFLKNKVMKKTYFYAKEKHIRKRFLKFLANRHNIIIMDLNRDLKLSLQKLAEVLRNGRNLIIFPEGTRSQDGRIGAFKKTFAILSREMNIPVIPVSIKGAIEAMPRGSKFPRPWKRIKVKFHEPVYPGNHTYESLSNEVYASIQHDLAPS